MSYFKQYNPFPIQIGGLLRTILAYILLPNLVIYSFCLYIGINRSIIDIDYFIPLILLSIFRFKLSDLAVFILFFMAFFVDILLIALQYFPFVKLQDIVYLSSFIFLGPTVYRLALLIVIILFVLEFFIITKIIKKITKKDIIFILLFIACLQLMQTTYRFYFNKHSNVTIASSSIFFLIAHHDSNFFNLNKLDILEPISSSSATKPWFNQLERGETLNNKLLLIVNESWGTPNSQQIQEETLKKLKSQTEFLTSFNQGEFSVIGATLAGELRELCQLKPNLLDIASVNKGFEHCLPNILKKQGYNTISVHGASDLILYNRSHWYPLAGFNISLAGDDFNLPKNPYGFFDSISDLDLIPIINQAFKKNNKLFYYWMTISTHAPYAIGGIKNPRFSCNTFDIPEDSEPCHNLMLQTQFFDNLADLIKKPEMQGVEVIVVGDHAPPFINFKRGLYSFAPSKVSWIHFKVK